MRCNCGNKHSNAIRDAVSILHNSKEKAPGIEMRMYFIALNIGVLLER
jgi:hypothetical protein